MFQVKNDAELIKTRKSLCLLSSLPMMKLQMPLKGLKFDFICYEIHFLSFLYKVLTLDYIWNSYLRSIMLLSGIYFPCLSFDVFNLQHFKNWSYFPQVVDNYATKSSLPLDPFYSTFKCMKNVAVILFTREYVRYKSVKI